MTLPPHLVHMLRYWAAHWRRTRDRRFGPTAIARLEGLHPETVRRHYHGQIGVRIR